MSGLHLVVWLLYYCSPSLLHPCPLKGDVTVFVFFITALESLADCTPVVSFFFSTFHIVVLAVLDAWAIALIDFSSFLSFKMA